MVATVHDDAAGEVTLPVSELFGMPSSLVAALGNRSWRYIVPTSAAGGAQTFVGLVSNALSGANTPALTNTDLRNQSSRVNTTTSTTNVLVGQNFTDPGMNRGSAAGIGGFFICHRFCIPALTADAVVSIGLNNAVIAGGADPAATGNRIVLGASTGDANLTWISVDNTPTATKSATVISKANAIIGDPITAGPCVFEVRMWALPNAALIHCELLNRSLGTIVNASDITATLPLNTTTLRPTCVLGPKSNVNCQVDYIHFFGYW